MNEKLLVDGWINYHSRDNCFGKSKSMIGFEGTGVEFESDNHFEPILRFEVEVNLKFLKCKDYCY